jgi:predicted dehydrogenase
MKSTRREFLGLAAGAALAATTLGAGRAVAANDRIRFACAGVGGRGWALVKAAHMSKLADVVAICDVDERILENRAKELEEMSGQKPKTFTDVRDLIADDAIDALGVAMPNHWHVLASIWAMQNGKDVYCEKPISHTIFEGRQLVETWKQTGRVLQHGTQRRSEGPWQRMAERAKEGVIGDLYMARAWITRRRDAFNYPFGEEPPAHLHWNLWQGPAPQRDFSRNYVHYNWHWFWDYGNGEIGNNGPHNNDLVNWVFDKGLPVKIASTGGIFGYPEGADVRETPNTQETQYTFADGAIYTMEVRNRPTEDAPLITLYGSNGYSKGTTFYDAEGTEIPDEQPKPSFPDSTATHMQNFLEAVHAKDPAATATTPEQGHVAAGLSHLANIAYRTGRQLTFDPATEQFAGDDEANALLTREYREGFEVPTVG